MSSNPASSGGRRRYPLYVHLSVLFSALVLAAGSAIAWLGYIEPARYRARRCHQTVRSHCQRNPRRGQRHVPAGAAASSKSWRTSRSSALVRLDARLQALSLMVHAFDDAAPVAAIYVGYDDGSFFLLRPLRDSVERIAFAAPDGSAFLVQSVEAGSAGARRAIFIFLDRSLRELGRSAWDAPFDPRERPVVSAWPPSPANACSRDPYVFATTHAPGLTVASARWTAPSLALDLTLAKISEQLAALAQHAGHEDRAVRSAATSPGTCRHVDRTMVRQDGDRVVLATLDEFGEPVLAGLQPLAPGATTEPTRRSRPTGAMEDERAADPDTYQGLLSLAIAAPLDELLKDARAARTRSLLAALAVLLLSIPLTWWAAHRVARNLRDITRTAGEIRAFKFDGAAPGPSDGARGRSAVLRDRNDPQHDPALSRHRCISGRGNRFHAPARSRRARDFVHHRRRSWSGVSDCRGYRDARARCTRTGELASRFPQLRRSRSWPEPRRSLRRSATAARPYQR